MTSLRERALLERSIVFNPSLPSLSTIPGKSYGTLPPMPDAMEDSSELSPDFFSDVELLPLTRTSKTRGSFTEDALLGVLFCFSPSPCFLKVSLRTMDFWLPSLRPDLFLIKKRKKVSTSYCLYLIHRNNEQSKRKRKEIVIFSIGVS